MPFSFDVVDRRARVLLSRNRRWRDVPLHCEGAFSFALLSYRTVATAVVVLQRGGPHAENAAADFQL